MTTKDEALKLALEALEWNLPVVEDWGGKDNLSLQHKAITAIREALAEQPEQQPVSVTDELVDAYCWAWAQSFVTNNPYHTVKMTTEDRKHIAAGLRAALADQPAQQQEPVAWMWRCKPYCGWPEWSVSLKRPADSGRDGHKRTEGYEDVPLYTPPPASKPWVGLTDEEVDECYYWKDRQWTTDELVRHVEAKLKEKNA